MYEDTYAITPSLVWQTKHSGIMITFRAVRRRRPLFAVVIVNVDVNSCCTLFLSTYKHSFFLNNSQIYI
ncbi:hypothetical protein BLOT_011880, partial [Blomia tropicalis]